MDNILHGHTALSDLANRTFLIKMLPGGYSQNRIAIIYWKCPEKQQSDRFLKMFPGYCIKQRHQFRTFSRYSVFKVCKEFSMKTIQKTLFSSALLSTIFVLGCSNGNVRFGGQVTYSDDGSPLTMGTVCFESSTFLARGELDSNGRYDLGSLSAKDGIPQGTYRVYITGAAKGGMNEKGVLVLVPLIDPKYVAGNTSGLSVTIDGKSRSFDIQVNRYQPPTK